MVSLAGNHDRKDSPSRGNEEGSIAGFLETFYRRFTVNVTLNSDVLEQILVEILGIKWDLMTNELSYENLATEMLYVNLKAVRSI